MNPLASIGDPVAVTTDAAKLAVLQMYRRERRLESPYPAMREVRAMAAHAYMACVDVGIDPSSEYMQLALAQWRAAQTYLDAIFENDWGLALTSHSRSAVAA